MLIKPLNINGLIKKATDSYKNCLTKIGKEPIMAQGIKGLVLVPKNCNWILSQKTSNWKK